MKQKKKAEKLFEIAEQRGLICAGKSEKDLNDELFMLAKELYGIEKYWHKRIVRSGSNTLQPYDENPPNLTIRDDKGMVRETNKGLQALNFTLS